MDTTFRWGIMGAGAISHAFLSGVKQVRGAKAVAIASRNRAHAQAVADRFEIETVEDNYESLAAREDLDAVYVCTPHTAHMEIAALALQRGQNVLCEKPMCINVAQAQELEALAVQNQVFLMEGFWTAFFPCIERISTLIKEQAIGRVRMIDARFCFRTPSNDKQQRLLNPMLAGGALLDVGVYPLHFCQQILGSAPLSITGYASINADEYQFGVDEQAVMIAQYPDQVLATMACAVKTKMEEYAHIVGEKGEIYLKPFWRPDHFVLKNASGDHEYYLPILSDDQDFPDTGFQYEIRHVQDCVLKKRLNSPVVSWEMTNNVLRACDMLRARWGLIYPCEFV